MCISCYKYLLQSSWYLTRACDPVNDCVYRMYTTYSTEESYTTLVRLQVIIYKLKLLGDHNWLMIVGNFSLILLYDDNLVAIMYKCVNNNTL